MTSASPRYLLCRPRGGLNDTLCQIERCWDYAERYGRTLIVDTSRSGLLLPCSEFFTPVAGDAIFSLSDHRLAGIDLDSMDCRPALLQGRTTAQVIPRRRRIRTADGTRAQTSFDFSRDHAETLLIHEDYGGSFASQKFLNRVRFADAVATEIRAALAELGSVDAAIHLRNTDYKTPLDNFFGEVKPKLAGRRVLICCDDPATIARVRQSLDGSEVVTATEIVDKGGQPLHNPRAYQEDAERRRASVNSLIDLCALATAPELYVVQLNFGAYSGFSELAVFLSQNPGVLNTLLGIIPGATHPPAVVTRVQTKSPFRVLFRLTGWNPLFGKRLRRKLNKLRRRIRTAMIGR